METHRNHYTAKKHHIEQHIITGRLTRDAELRYTPNGTPVLSFSVANNTGFGDNEKTQFFDCSLFGKRAEGKLKEFMKKGKRLLVEGNRSLPSMRHNLHLGYLDKTDVLEVYLKHPDSDIYTNHAVEIDKQIAWTMAVVLRQALADVLGIASDDTALPLNQRHCQIVLMQWQPSLFMMCAVAAVVFHVQPRPIFSKY